MFKAKKAAVFNLFAPLCKIIFKKAFAKPIAKAK